LVLKDFANINENKFKEFLKDTKGDLIEAFIFLYAYLLQSFKVEENKNFFKNTFLNMSHRMEKTIAPEFKKDDKSDKLKELMELIDISKLNIGVMDDVPLIFKILMNLTISNIVENFAKQLSFEEAISSYKKQIELIRNGIYKKDPNSI